MCINGGYILLARNIDESEVSSFPPHVREIWLYLLRNASHKDINIAGIEIKRGQLLTSYEQIINDLSWKVGYRTERYKKHHCGTSMKLLTKAQMIATTKTTRGMIVTICKYDYYQSPENYETNSETNNEQTMNKQSSHTIIYKNERSKEEYYKEKIYKKEKFNFLSELKKIGVKEEVAKSWMEVRKNKKAVNTKIAFDRIKKEIEATGVPANDCITFAVENSWSGFKSEWYSNKKGAFKVPTTFQNF